MAEGTFLFKRYKRRNVMCKRKSRNRYTENDAEFITEFGREIINKLTTLVSISKEVFSIGNVINIEHFSDLIKLFCLSAWVLRFVINLKKKHSGRKLN